MGAKMKIIVMTSDKGNWALKAFKRQWDKYCGLPFTVFGFTDPEIDGLDFVSVGMFEDYPARRWSDGLIRALRFIDDPFVLLLLEDYWLHAKVNVPMIRSAEYFMRSNPYVFRFDLSTDLLNSKPAPIDRGYAGPFKAFQAVTQDYRMSTQAGLFNRYHLLTLLKSGESPWQFELAGNTRLCEDRQELEAWGFYDSPVIPYMIAVNKGKLDRSGAWMSPPRTLSDADWQDLDKLGYTVEG